MTKRYRPDVALPRELVVAQRHFASGINHPGEVEGLVGNVGITFGTLRRGCLEALELRGGSSVEVFVDSGAFGEVEFGPEGRTVVKPIADADWAPRFELYRRVGLAFGTRARVVAPDCVGDQVETLRRLERFAPDVAAVASTRAQVIVPVQKGALPLSAFYARACAILGLRRAPIAGVPMMKDATSIEDLRELVASMSWDDCRVHLLGIGPKARRGRYWAAVRAILELRPSAEVTTDSALVPSITGRDGKDGRARPLTRYQDEARAAGATASRDVKAIGLGRYSMEVTREADLDAMHAAGWFDVELYDSLEEALAHRAAGYP